MPLDPATGLWTTPPLNENPGPGGPSSWTGGLLDIMNAFRSHELTKQADAARQQAEMDAISKNAALGGYDMSQTPEGQGIAEAFNISPETTSQIYEQSSNRQLRQALSELTQKYPEQQIPSWEIENAYITRGVTPPTGLYGYMGREKTAETSANRISNTQVQHMMTVGVQAQKASQAAGDDEATQRKKAEDAMGPGLAMLNDQQRESVQAALDAARDEATGGTSKIPAARAAELTARAGAETARANYLNKIAGPMAEKLADQHGLSDLRADILRLNAQILRQKQAGTLTPAERNRTIAQIAALEAKRADRMNAPIIGMGVSDEVATAERRRVLKEYAEAIKELRASLAAPATATAPAAAPTTAGEGWQEGDTVHYPDGTSSTLSGGAWTPRK